MIARPLIAVPLLCGLLWLLPARADWPMLAHDPARSGATADEIRPPFARKWYRAFPDQGLQSGVQPVVAGGRLVIGTLQGRIYCIDAKSGEDLWVRPALGPVLHTAAISRDLVFVPAGRQLLALRLKTGGIAWSFDTPFTLWSSPVVVGDAVIFGDRAGRLHCLDHAGRERWSASTPAPLLNSPAVDVKAGAVYIGCEDMRFYAFALADGKAIWTSPMLPGVSFRGYHPVVAPDGAVMITVTPHAGGDAMQGLLLEMVKAVFGEFDSWRIKDPAKKKQIREANFALLKDPATYRKEMDYIRKRLTDEPALQTFFVLDPATGRPRFVAPIVYAESMNGPCAPPVVTPTGKVIVKYSALLRSRYGHYSPFLNVGYLDTATGQITPIMDQSRTYGWHNSLLLVHDEQSQLAVAGNVLINTHQDNVNAMDLQTLKGYDQPFAFGVHEIAPGVASALWVRQLQGRLPTGWEWLPRGSAVYGGGSAIDTSVVVDGNSFYYLPTHEINAGVCLIAYQMSRSGRPLKEPQPTRRPTAADNQEMRQLKWDWDMLATPRLKDAFAPDQPPAPPGTLQNPLTDQAEAAVARITDQQLDALIFAKLELTPDPLAVASLRSELASAVRERITHNFKPLIFPAAKAPSESYRLYFDPIETLYGLALAYPNLPPALQRDVRNYVSNRILAGDDALGRRRFDAAGAVPRTDWDPAPTSLTHIADDLTRPPAGRVYPIWLWAQATGDTAWIRQHRTALYSAALSGADTDPASEPDLGNARLAGLIAACRIARQALDAEILHEKLLPATHRLLRQRLKFEFAHSAGGLATRAPVGRTLLGRWHFLTPDVAHVLRAFTRPIQQDLMTVYIDHNRPAWYIAWNVELMWRNEAPFSMPGMAGDIFAARALILGEPALRLAPFLDIPWCRGDELQLQKLALLLLQPTFTEH